MLSLAQTITKLCQDKGLAATTSLLFHETGEQVVARMGVAICGTTQMGIADYQRCEFNPFHPEFADNYIEGIGGTKKGAIEDLLGNLKVLCESLWE